MKKLVSILLALAMILAMSTTIFAAEEPAQKFTLTIQGAKDHDYDIYQIFTGKVSQENGEPVLSDVKYGHNFHPDGTAAGGKVDKDDLDEFKNLHASAWDTLKSGTPFMSGVNKDDKETVEIADVPAGYYLIKDVTQTLQPGDTLSPIILYVLDDTPVTSKQATIVSEKKVYDVNDSFPDNPDTGWQDVADHDIGDDVRFQLSVTLPSTMMTYQDYTLTFHDKMSGGFGDPVIDRVYVMDKNGNVKFTIDEVNNQVVNGYQKQLCTSVKCELGKPCSFTVEVGDIKKLYENAARENGTISFVNEDKLIVEYHAQLKQGADTHIGKDTNHAFNENAMYVCHPDGHTPIDYVSVLTYELTIHKVDSNGQPLEGVGFTLYKWVSEEKDGQITWDWKQIGEELKADGLTSFVWSGIDGGKYKLSETTVPDTYNSVADMIFVVDATHATEWTKGTNYAFYNLIAKDENGGVVFFDQDANAQEDGKLEGTVVNHKGAVLPETGAEGTFFLITGGTLLVLVAVVFMITRKKMSIYED